MSHPAQNTSLSLSTRLLCYLGPPSTILLTAAASPQTALLSPLAFLPTALLLRKWKKLHSTDPSRRGELEPMIWTYAATGTLGFTAVLLVQMGVCKAASAILFGPGKINDDFWTEFGRGTIEGLTTGELARRAELASSWQNWVFNGALTFIAASLGEETLKYLPIAYARRRGTPKERQQRNRAYIDYALAAALSFGVVEGIGFLYAACEVGNESWPKLLLTLFERFVLGQVGHLSVAALTALRAIRRDYYGDQLSWWGVVGPSVVWHGAYDFIAMSASALGGNVGWIHPTGTRNTIALLGTAITMVTAAVWQVQQEWKSIDSRNRASKSSEGDNAKS